MKRLPTTSALMMILAAMAIGAPKSQGQAPASPAMKPPETAQRAGTFRNPVIPGFNPDPSICRVGDDYYVLTSTFEHFPAFPIYHSKDLVHWTQVGNVLSRRSQISLEGVGPSDGLFSPTMRFHNGTFYVTFTMLKYEPAQRITNHVVTAKAPEGPWSDPVLITDDPMWRIDTSLFFDEDGRCYFTANSKIPGQSRGRRNLMQEIDPVTFKLKGPVHDLGRGAYSDSTAAEGAHIFRRNGYYYLLIAEGGTGWNHAVSISRSTKVEGPYVQCPGNILLTHKNLNRQEATTGALYGVGHSDWVETGQGEWWMVLLAQRGKGVLGRETALVPIEWKDDDWPVVNPGIGRVQRVERLPKFPPGTAPTAAEPRVGRDEFDEDRLGPQWMFVRVPPAEFWSLQTRHGWLRLTLQPATAAFPAKEGSPSLISRRVLSHDFSAITKLEFTPASEDELAGILLRRGANSISAVKGLAGGKPVVRVVIETREGRKTLAEKEVPTIGSGVFLKAVCRREAELEFYFSENGERWVPVGEKIDGEPLSNKASGGVYTGTTVGVYASSQGKPTSSHADFEFFEYRDEEPEPDR